MTTYERYMKAMEKLEAETIARAQEAKTPQQKKDFQEWATEAQERYVWYMRMAEEFKQ